MGKKKSALGSRRKPILQLGDNAKTGASQSTNVDPYRQTSVQSTSVQPAAAPCSQPPEEETPAIDDKFDVSSEAAKQTQSSEDTKFQDFLQEINNLGTNGPSSNTDTDENGLCNRKDGDKVTQEDETTDDSQKTDILKVSAYSSDPETVDEVGGAKDNAAAGVTFWKQVVDPNTNHAYYWNPQTNDVCWTLPDNAVITADDDNTSSQPAGDSQYADSYAYYSQAYYGESRKKDDTNSSSAPKKTGSNKTGQTEPKSESPYLVGPPAEEVFLGPNLPTASVQPDIESRPVADTPSSDKSKSLKRKALVDEEVESVGGQNLHSVTKKPRLKMKSSVVENVDGDTSSPGKAQATSLTKHAQQAMRFQVSNMADELSRKLRYLHVTMEGLSDLQVLNIQLQTRLSDWKEGKLTSKYMLSKLRGNSITLSECEQSAAPDGWKVIWDSSSCRYQYYNLSTGESTWQYPVQFTSESQFSSQEDSSDHETTDDDETADVNHPPIPRPPTGHPATLEATLVFPSPSDKQPSPALVEKVSMAMNQQEAEDENTSLKQTPAIKAPVYYGPTAEYLMTPETPPIYRRRTHTSDVSPPHPLPVSAHISPELVRKKLIYNLRKTQPSPKEQSPVIPQSTESEDETAKDVPTEDSAEDQGGVEFISEFPPNNLKVSSNLQQTRPLPRAESPAVPQPTAETTEEDVLTEESTKNQTWMEFISEFPPRSESEVIFPNSEPSKQMMESDTPSNVAIDKTSSGDEARLRERLLERQKHRIKLDSKGHDENFEEIVIETTTVDFEITTVSTTDMAEQSATDWVEQSATDWVEQSATDWVEQSATDWVEQSASDMVEQSTTDMVEQSTTDMVEQSTTDMVDQSTTDMVEQSTTDMVEQSTTDMVEQSTTDMVEQSTTDMVDQSTTDMVEQSTTDMVEQSTTDMVEQSTTDMVEQSATDMVEQSATDMVEQSATDMVEQSATDMVEQSATDMVEQSATDMVEQSTTDMVEQSTGEHELALSDKITAVPVPPPPQPDRPGQGYFNDSRVEPETGIMETIVNSSLPETNSNSGSCDLTLEASPKRVPADDETNMEDGDKVEEGEIVNGSPQTVSQSKKDSLDIEVIPLGRCYMDVEADKVKQKKSTDNRRLDSDKSDTTNRRSRKEPSPSSSKDGSHHRSSSRKTDRRRNYSDSDRDRYSDDDRRGSRRQSRGSKSHRRYHDKDYDRSSDEDDYRSSRRDSHRSRRSSRNSRHYDRDRSLSDDDRRERDRRSGNSRHSRKHRSRSRDSQSSHQSDHRSEKTKKSPSTKSRREKKDKKDKKKKHRKGDRERSREASPDQKQSPHVIVGKVGRISSKRTLGKDKIDGDPSTGTPSQEIEVALMYGSTLPTSSPTSISAVQSTTALDASQVTTSTYQSSYSSQSYAPILSVQQTTPQYMSATFYQQPSTGQVPYYAMGSYGDSIGSYGDYQTTNSNLFQQQTVLEQAFVGVEGTGQGQQCWTEEAEYGTLESAHDKRVEQPSVTEEPSQGAGDDVAGMEVSNEETEDQIAECEMEIEGNSPSDQPVPQETKTDDCLGVTEQSPPHDIVETVEVVDPQDLGETQRDDKPQDVVEQLVPQVLTKTLEVDKPDNETPPTKQNLEETVVIKPIEVAKGLHVVDVEKDPLPPGDGFVPPPPAPSTPTESSSLLEPSQATPPVPITPTESSLPSGPSQTVQSSPTNLENNLNVKLDGKSPRLRVEQPPLPSSEPPSEFKVDDVPCVPVAATDEERIPPPPGTEALLESDSSKEVVPQAEVITLQVSVNGESERIRSKPDLETSLSSNPLTTSYSTQEVSSVPVLSADYMPDSQSYYQAAASGANTTGTTGTYDYASYVQSLAAQQQQQQQAYSYAYAANNYAGYMQAYNAYVQQANAAATYGTYGSQYYPGSYGTSAGGYPAGSNYANQYSTGTAYYGTGGTAPSGYSAASYQMTPQQQAQALTAAASVASKELTSAESDGSQAKKSEFTLAGSKQKLLKSMIDKWSTFKDSEDSPQN